MPEEMPDVRDLVRSAVFWCGVFIIGLFAFLAFGAPYLLRVVGWLFKAMGGQSLEDMGI